jgi:four helix bundle protein
VGATFEDLKILRSAEEIADEVWQQVVSWDTFAREVVGAQLARAADSIGANIAESFGRFHYGEKLNFLYYARGSLLETKYWLNRAFERKLMDKERIEAYTVPLTNLARQLNAFAGGIKAQRKGSSKTTKLDS